MDFTQTYNATPTYEGLFGNGWSFSYDEFLTSSTYPGESVAMVSRGSGKGVSFSTPVPTGASLVPPVTFSPEGGHFDRLTYGTGGHWIYEPKGSHSQYRFEAILPPIVGGSAGSAQFHLTRITDANGNTVVVERDTDATIRSVTGSAGRVTTFSYASYGGAPRCTLMTTPDGRTANYSYDSRGNLLQSTDLLGTVTSYTYDGDNYLTSITAAGATTRFTWSGSGANKRIASVTDGEGNVITYSKSGSQVAARDALDHTYTYRTSADHPKTTTLVVDPLGNETTTVSGASGPTEMIDPWSYRTLMQYDSRGNLTRLERPHGHITTYTYDADDNLLTTTDAYGNVWTNEYDANHNLTKRISPSGRETTFSYDNAGQLIATTDPEGNTTSFIHDSYGNVLSKTDALSQITSYVYDTYGFHMLSETDPQSRTTSYSYDDNDRVTRITHPDSRYIEYTYDAAVLTSRRDENGVLFNIEHDRNFAAKRMYDGLGNYTSFTYDGAGKMTSVRDPLGNVSTYSYDGNGNQTGITNPLGQSKTFQFDTRNLPSRYTDQHGNVTDFLHDGNRFLLYVWGPPGAPSPQNPGGSGPGYQYDKLGRLSAKYSGTNKVEQTYTSDGQLHQILHNNVLAGTFSYDSAGNLSGFTDWAGTTSFDYDSLNRMTGIHYPDGLSLSHTLLPDGLPQVIHYPGGLDVSYSYDNRRRATGISFSGGNISLTHDAVGRVTSIHRSNGTSSNYQYDANGRITNINHRRNTTSFATMMYSRDAAGNVISETGDLPLPPIIPGNDLNNIFNAYNQLTSSGGQTCSYDAAGNLTAMNGIRDLSAAYDAADRLVSLTASSKISSFAYNLMGGRSRIIQDSVTRNLHSDLQNRLLFESDDVGTVVAIYIYDGLRPLVMLRDGEVFFYHYDQRGSTVALTDSAGDLAASYVYSPFGRILNRSGQAANPFTWLGALGVMDDGDNIYFMRNRHYDALSGRFLQQDPVGFDGGTNLYAYVGNNPINVVDPLGLRWLDWGDVAAVGNTTIGVLGFSASLTAMATAPTWGGVAICGFFATAAVARIYSVFNNVDYYSKEGYGPADALTDVVDPTRLRDMSVWVKCSEIESRLRPTVGPPAYGNLKSSTVNISFPEFTVPGFSLDL